MRYRRRTGVVDVDNSLIRGTLAGALLGGAAGAAVTRNKIHASGGAARGGVAGIVCSLALASKWFDGGSGAKGTAGDFSRRSRQALRGATVGAAVCAGLASIVGPRMAPVSPLTIGVEAGVAGAMIGASVDSLVI